MIKLICKDPFGLLFPIGVTLALYASVSWVLFTFFQIGEYPGQLHAKLFIGGYLYLTILGFLMTAIPRFTKTQFSSTFDIILIFIYSIFLWSSILFSRDNDIFFWTTITIGWLHIIIFAIQRFHKRKQNPPQTFIFVALGVLMGLVGSISLVLSGIWEIEFIDLENLGKLFFYDGMVLALILGIGGRLIPGILGFKEVVSDKNQSQLIQNSFLKTIPMSLLLMLLLFLISFILEVFELTLFAYSLRAIVVSYIALKNWQIHKRPVEKKINNTILRLSCLTLVIALWLLVFFPQYQIDIRHLIYIGSYSLITFIVAARVTLAHGNEGLELEKRHFPFSIFGGLLLFAALTRATAIMIPNSYLNHLGYAAVLYVISIVLWGIIFIPKMFKTKY